MATAAKHALKMRFIRPLLIATLFCNQDENINSVPGPIPNLIRPPICTEETFGHMPWLPLYHQSPLLSWLHATCYDAMPPGFRLPFPPGSMSVELHDSALDSDGFSSSSKSMGSGGTSGWAVKLKYCHTWSEALLGKIVVETWVLP